MKRTLMMLGAALALSAGAVEVDGIAATVGTKQILRSDVYAAMRRQGPATIDESRYEAVRNDLIERALILKAAEDAKMQMQDWVVEDRVRTIIEDGFGGDRNRLVETLSREKIPYADWRRRIKEELIVGAMIWNTVTKHVRASPAEMRAEYAEHPERYRAEAKVTVSVILLKPADAAKREEVAEVIRTESFAEAARRFSADTHAAEGGVWKEVDPAEVFKPQVSDEIAKMPKGAVSPWIEIDGWSFLLRKDDETAAAPRSFADAYDDIEAHVLAANRKKLTEAWVERMKADTYIRIY